MEKRKYYRRARFPAATIQEAHDLFLLGNHGPKLALLTIQQKDAYPIRFEQCLSLNRNQLQKRNHIPDGGHPFADVENRPQPIRVLAFALRRRDLDSRRVHRLLPNTTRKTLSTKATHRQQR